MAKSREPRGYFTIKISDEHYAMAAQAATVKGISIAELMRDYLRALPPVTPEIIEAWKKYRHRSGHERLSMPVEYMASVGAQISTAVPKAMSADRIETPQEMYERIKREGLMQDALAAQAIRDLKIEKRAAESTLTIIERTELEELAAQGDKEARQVLEEDDKKRQQQKLVQL